MSVHLRREARPGSRPGRRPRVGARRTVLGAIAQIPAYLRLLFGLLTDARVSGFDRLLVVAAVAYVISPLDLIPDFIPFLGQVDDLYVLVLAIKRLIARAGVDVLADHWSGDPRDLTASSLDAVLLAAAFFLPVRLRRRLRHAL